MLFQRKGIVVGQSRIIVVFVDIMMKPLDAVKCMLHCNRHVEPAAVAELDETLLTFELAELMLLHPKVLVCVQR
jgi:ethanolamine transporter EutH